MTNLAVHGDDFQGRTGFELRLIERQFPVFCRKGEGNQGSKRERANRSFGHTIFTSTRSTTFRMYPAGFHSASSGCDWPMRLMARTFKVVAPFSRGVNSVVQSRNEKRPRSFPSSASRQLVPLSVETSTVLMP